jgi:hypothetical protein
MRNCYFLLQYVMRRYFDEDDNVEEDEELDIGSFRGLRFSGDVCLILFVCECSSLCLSSREPSIVGPSSLLYHELGSQYESI